MRNGGVSLMRKQGTYFTIKRKKGEYWRKWAEQNSANIYILGLNFQLHI